jgi:hypothetical protein
LDRGWIKVIDFVGRDLSAHSAPQIAILPSNFTWISILGCFRFAPLLEGKIDISSAWIGTKIFATPAIWRYWSPWHASTSYLH